MDLRAALLKEHSKVQTSKIVRYIGNKPDRFTILVKIYLAGPYRITQRAAWPLGNCVEAHPQLITPHWKTLIDFAKKPGVHDAVKRNTVRLLQFIDIPAKHQGKVADLCFAFLQDTSEPIAVRCFSMTVLSRIAKEKPELKNELRILIEDQFPYGTPGFLSRAKKVLKQLQSQDF
jgi:hypothetical protein